MNHITSPDTSDAGIERLIQAKASNAPRVIENDRALLPPPGGVGLKPPPRPVAGSTH